MAVKAHLEAIMTIDPENRAAAAKMPARSVRIGCETDSFCQELGYLRLSLTAMVFR